MSVTESIKRIRHLIGKQALSYILNLSTDKLDLVLNSEYSLEKSQEQVLNKLENLLSSIRLVAASQNDPLSYIDFRLYGLAVRGTRHIFNQLREEAGGKICEPLTDDEVIRALTSLAMETYPSLIISPSYKYRTKNLMLASNPPYDHKDNETFTSAVLEDSALSKLFHHRGKDAIETGGSLMMSTGRGGSIQLATFASSLIGSAYVLMRMRNEISPHHFLEHIRAMVSIARKAAIEQKVNVPVFLGFKNVGVPQKFQLDLPLGNIRDVREGDLEIIPQEAKPATYSGKELLGFVLETEIPYEILSRNSPLSGSMSSTALSKIEATHEKLNLLSEKLAMTLAIGIKRDPPVGVNRSWTLIIDPLNQGHNISWSSLQRSAVPSYVINKKDYQAIEEWGKRINGINDHNIRIAVRRIVLALSHRDNPVDGFIDAIIAWENLFGGGTEKSFRISMAMSLLLSNDPEERNRLQSKIAKQYNNRSSVVHGDKELKPKEASTERDKALSLILDCLRRLYMDYPALIEDKNRARRLLLRR